MPTQIRERENMPEISTAARETLSERPDYHEQHTSEQSNLQVIEKCKVCNKPYEPEETNQIIATLPTIANFDYDKQCLNCIKQMSQSIRASYQPALKEAKESLDELTIIYQKAHNHYKLLTKKYQKYDYQENMINHHQQQKVAKETAAKKPSTKKKTKTNKQIKQATAMKILGNLSNEQQIAILAIMAKQE